VLFALVHTLAATASHAQTAAPDAYPRKPVRLIVGYGAGGSTDIVARVVAQRLTERWGVQALVDNRPGADTIIATELVGRSEPDGYTLLVANSTNGTNPAVRSKLPYDPARDFTSVAMIGAAANLLTAHPALPVNSVKELIVLAKAKPGQITYGSVGAGSVQHLLMEYFALRAGVKLNHVPYKSGGAAITDTMAGHISSMLAAVASQAPFVKAGKLKPLVVFSAKRSAALPHVGTIGEAGLSDLQSDYWIGIMGPANMPAAVVSKINADINAVLQLPATRETFGTQGVVAMPGSPRDMDEYYKKELLFWAKVVRDVGLERN
jgi:tripartite-type tricarboxylate transporter receptor subunit TctC